MYIDKEGKDWVVVNESGHVIATRKSEKDAQKFRLCFNNPLIFSLKLDKILCS